MKNGIKIPLSLFKDVFIEELPKLLATEDKEGTITSNLLNSS
jgi:hypothetical protein